MLKSTIGLNAGQVWKVLEKGETNVKGLKKATKLTDKDLFLALGWLARESKVTFNENENELIITLV